MTTILIQILTLLVMLAGVYRIWRRLRHFLHVLQLEGYKSHEFMGWIQATGRPFVIRKEHVAAGSIVVILLVLTRFTATPWVPIVALLLWLPILGSARDYRSDKVKKPLVFTPRMRRLTGSAAFIAAIAFLAVLSFGLAVGWLVGLLAALLVVDAAAPFLVLIAGKLTTPVENTIQLSFKRDARDRLDERPDLTVIGITGSYGKTSVKFAVAEILSQRYSVLATPGSYNTPMGICKVINDELRPMHQYLVLEMGARYRGDIQELCEIAEPDVAVLTSIGVAHLETMGSQDGIIKTKSELIEHMKPGGAVIANYDDANVMRIARTSRGPVTTVSISSPEADIFAADISYGLEGCRFVVTMDHEREEMNSSLLGAHNVTNILLGIGVGRLFGLRLRQMRHAVGRLRPVPHRLQLRKEGAITVIDDSFNSNPVGARNAVEILGQFNGGKRVIVTPGMVELGDRQDDENRELGRFMAGNIDLAVLVGPRQTEPIKEGLLSAGFPEDSIIVSRSLFDARDLLRERLSAGDVVLYENDLPDHYDE